MRHLLEVIMRTIGSILVLLLLVGPTLAQSESSASVRSYLDKNKPAMIKEFLELLSLPNVASDTKNINRNAEYLKKELEKRGLNARLLRHPDAKVPPAVFGEWNVSPKLKTIVFYAHYDGQPTEPSDWKSVKPWEPKLFDAPLEKGGTPLRVLPGSGKGYLPNWRVYGRSAADDKAGVFTILRAISYFRAHGINPSANIKVFFEGEEEAGSAHLRRVLEDHKELLESDAWIICDGPVHQSGRKQVVFGVRGVTSVDLTVYGANRDLHSGHYGNWAPNPGFLLTELLASMRDKNGRVTIKGFYDDVVPLGKREMDAIRKAPAYDEELKRQLGLNQTEGPGKSLLELLNLPSLNINGMKTGDVGPLARNVIPSTANAVIGLRLVRGVNHTTQVERLRAHIESQGYYVISRDPTNEERLKYPKIAKFIPETGGYNAQRTSMNLPVSIAVTRSVAANSEGEIVALPTLGGSLPLSIISETLGDVPTITVPIANYDNNQHAADENLRLGNLWDGIVIYVGLMTMKF